MHVNESEKDDEMGSLSKFGFEFRKSKTKLFPEFKYCCCKMHTKRCIVTMKSTVHI